MKKAIFSILLLLPLAANASTLYKCTDKTSVVLYTNQKTSGMNCKVLSQQSPPPAGNKSAKPRTTSTSTPTDFPRVSNREQKARDGVRKEILDRELANELRSLEKAQSVLAAAGTQPEDKLQPFRDTVALHERNVEAIKKELANLR